jgi:Tfp pilus assembly protein PilP
MTKVVGIVAVLMLLAGCGEQLASEAKRFADQVKEEATKTAVKKIEDLRIGTLQELRQMRGEAPQTKVEEKPVKKPAEPMQIPQKTVDVKATPKADW